MLNTFAVFNRHTRQLIDPSRWRISSKFELQIDKEDKIHFLTKDDPLEKIKDTVDNHWFGNVYILISGNPIMYISKVFYEMRQKIPCYDYYNYYLSIKSVLYTGQISHFQKKLHQYKNITTLLKYHRSYQPFSLTFNPQNSIEYNIEFLKKEYAKKTISKPEPIIDPDFTFIKDFIGSLYEKKWSHLPVKPTTKTHDEIMKDFRQWRDKHEEITYDSVDEELYFRLRSVILNTTNIVPDGLFFDI